jgi:hypothetical protein
MQNPLGNSQGLRIKTFRELQKPLIAIITSQVVNQTRKRKKDQKSV